VEALEEIEKGKVNRTSSGSPREVVPSLDLLASKSKDFFEFLDLPAASLNG
jgi:hypothetical protein